MSNWATGVTVITSVAPRGPHGMTANAFLSVSLTPPLVLVSIGQDNDSYGIIQETGRFAVNILAADQEHLSRLFAVRRPSGESAFEGVPWHESPGGLPWIDGALGHLDCRVQEAVRVQDHMLFVAGIDALSDQGAGRHPLVYFQSGYTTTSGA